MDRMRRGACRSGKPPQISALSCGTGWLEYLSRSADRFVKHTRKKATQHRLKRCLVSSRLSGMPITNLPNMTKHGTQRFGTSAMLSASRILLASLVHGSYMNNLYYTSSPTMSATELCPSKKRPVRCSSGPSRNGLMIKKGVSPASAG